VGLSREAGEKCVLSDIVKRRSFRVSIVIERLRPVRTPGISPDRKIGWNALSAFCLTAGGCRFDLASWSF